MDALMYRAFTGVGSRPDRAPPDMLAVAVEIAKALSLAGYTCRTGGADGFDAAWLDGATQGALEGGAAPELYLPAPGFNGHQLATIATPSMAAYGIAARHHPAWSSCSLFAKKLHARNSHEVLGADLETPSKFLIAWTPDGADGINVPVSDVTRGTGQAIRIAVAWRIPVFNLRRPEHLARIREGLLKNPT